MTNPRLNLLERLVRGAGMESAEAIRLLNAYSHHERVYAFRRLRMDVEDRAYETGKHTLGIVLDILQDAEANAWPDRYRSRPDHMGWWHRWRWVASVGRWDHVGCVWIDDPDDDALDGVWMAVPIPPDPSPDTEATP